MNHVHLDTETFLVEPGILAPKMVCLQYNVNDEDSCILPAWRDDWKVLAECWLERDDYTIWGHRVPYDLAVMAKAHPKLLPLIFAKYRKGLIRDTRIAIGHYDISEGQFEWVDIPEAGRKRNEHSLAQYELRFTGKVRMKGVNSWQLKYHTLYGVPIDEWPMEAVDYALADADGTRDVANHCRDLGEAPMEQVTTRYAFSSHLMGVHGLRTDPVAVKHAHDHWTARRAIHEKALMESGYMRPDGTKDTKKIQARIEAICGDATPRTATGRVAMDKDTLKQLDDPELNHIIHHTHFDKRLSTYYPVLLKATERPFNPDWKPLVTSGRASCGSPDSPGNLMNLPREDEELDFETGKMKKTGRSLVRECYVPRPGFDFISCDLDTAEMRSMAEVDHALGFDSVLAQELRDGRDPHTAFAAEALLGITYEAAKAAADAGDKQVKEARQFAKIFNFGAPGGLGPDGLVAFARTAYGVRMERDRAVEIKQNWLDHYPERRRFFNWMAGRCEMGPIRHFVHPTTGFVRGDVGFTDGCNHVFQHLTAMCAKTGHFDISEEMYVKPESPLFGSRLVAFVHDETFGELKQGERQTEAAWRMAHLMKSAADQYIKSVPNGCSPALMTRWYKGAELVVKDGKIVPWEPKKKEEKAVAA